MVKRKADWAEGESQDTSPTLAKDTNFLMITALESIEDVVTIKLPLEDWDDTHNLTIDIKEDDCQR